MPRLVDLRAIVLAAAFAIVVGPAFAEPVRYTIDTKYYCTPDEACISWQTTVWNLIDRETGTYSRCDQQGCDTYTATFVLSGDFTVIEIPGRSILAKLSVLDVFTEIVTLGNDVYLSFGSCSKSVAQNPG